MEFEADEEEEIDVEETIEEQERHEKRRDVKQELDDLKDEGKSLFRFLNHVNRGSN